MKLGRKWDKIFGLTSLASVFFMLPSVGMARSYWDYNYYDHSTGNYPIKYPSKVNANLRVVTPSNADAPGQQGDLQKRRATLRDVRGEVLIIKEVKTKGAGEANRVVLIQTANADVHEQVESLNCSVTKNHQASK